MAEDFPRDVGISAAIGCATGFLWSALAGQADPGEGKGALYAIAGCAGSAAQGAAVYSTSHVISQDPALARQITAGWFGVQSAASFTNWMGSRYGLMDRPGFNAVAIPLNYLAAPFISSLGLLVAATGETINGFDGEVVAYGGALIFRHDLCGSSRYQTGAIGHKCTTTNWLEDRLHETAHTVQTSIMGEAGMLAGNILGIGVMIFIGDGRSFRSLLVTEDWADDYAEKTDHLPYLRRQLKLPESLDARPLSHGSIELRLRKPFVIDGIAYAADRPLICGPNGRGEYVVGSGTLAEDTVIDDVCYRRGTEIEFGDHHEVVSPKHSKGQTTSPGCAVENAGGTTVDLRIEQPGRPGPGDGG